MFYCYFFNNHCKTPLNDQPYKQFHQVQQVSKVPHSTSTPYLYALTKNITQFQYTCSFFDLPGNWLIFDLDLRISSASFCAVGSTFVWCSVIRYWANFWSCSLSICNNVSEIGSRNCTIFARRILYNDSATTCWHQKMSLFPHVHLTDVILHRSKLMDTWCACSGSLYNWFPCSVTVPLKWKPVEEKTKDGRGDG